MFYYTYTTTDSGRCQFCWNSPGTGYAVVEIWGASGSGGMMCCCAASGIPGNPGAYSKKIIPVCSGTYVCGWAGCATEANALCYPGRGNCSVACIFNSGANGTMIATAGFGGMQLCTTSTPQWCCFAICNFCRTNTGAGCGIVCNIGGPNAAVQATASGGDLNINGGVSCTYFWTCFNCCTPGYEHTVAMSPGIWSTTSSPCVRFNRNTAPTNFGYCGAHNGAIDQSTAIRNFAGIIPQYYSCWNGAHRDCSCYEFTGCWFNAAGIPGISGVPCAGVRSMGVRGGHGAVKITFYS